MESMQDVHTFAPSAIRLERADLGLVLGVDPTVVSPVAIVSQWQSASDEDWAALG
jgi:hypothetical protein